LFPLLFTAINSAALSDTAKLPGFPADTYLQFAVATVIVQGITFGASGAGTDLAVDIQGGFFDRLSSSPVSRAAILVGRVAGCAALGAFQVVLFVSLLAAFGADIAGGFPAVVVLVVGGTLLSIGMGGFSMRVAVKSGSPEVVQAMFPVFFALLFASSAFFPRELMAPWFKPIADINPLSYAVEGLRGVVVDGMSTKAVLEAVLIPAAIALASMTWCVMAFRKRVSVT
jgi:ABC-2 type transport system permease protein